MKSRTLAASLQLIQRRRLIASTRSLSTGTKVDGATCAGIDGSGGGGREVESDKEYFSHHKASPLSEIEVADTRKPITKATDKTNRAGDLEGGMVVWLPEQLESAEETLLKTAELWELNKMRGDPDAPHSRVLRALRGEEHAQLS